MKPAAVLSVLASLSVTLVFGSCNSSATRDAESVRAVTVNDLRPVRVLTHELWSEVERASGAELILQEMVSSRQSKRHGPASIVSAAELHLGGVVEVLSTPDGDAVVLAGKKIKYPAAEKFRRGSIDRLVVVRADLGATPEIVDVVGEWDYLLSATQSRIILTSDRGEILTLEREAREKAEVAPTWTPTRRVSHAASEALAKGEQARHVCVDDRGEWFIVADQQSNDILLASRQAVAGKVGTSGDRVVTGNSWVCNLDRRSLWLYQSGRWSKTDISANFDGRLESVSPHPNGTTWIGQWRPEGSSNASRERVFDLRRDVNVGWRTTSGAYRHQYLWLSPKWKSGPEVSER